MSVVKGGARGVCARNVCAGGVCSPWDQKQTSLRSINRQQRWRLKRAVRILLECILVRVVLRNIKQHNKSIFNRYFKNIREIKNSLGKRINAPVFLFSDAWYGKVIQFPFRLSNQRTVTVIQEKILLKRFFQLKIPKNSSITVMENDHDNISDGSNHFYYKMEICGYFDGYIFLFQQKSCKLK